MIRRYSSLLAIALLLVSSTIVFMTPKKAEGLSGASWQAGRIIDDVVFTDKYSMSAAQVQDFLNQKVGTGGYGRVAGQCDTLGQATSEYGGGTRADYGTAHGNPAPFTCLKDYYEVPKTSPGAGVPANNYGGQPIPAGAKSAAQIIYDAAQAYNISPKVLLTTIQKESAGPLTTDDWPFLKQYTYAMGAHCPDTASCDPNYAGFSIQIYESARLFRYYLDNMTQSWWPYKKPGVNTILYNPNTGCGSSDVNITTKATAALYTYTPYQPNQAALNNLYGSGDSCSAYGNRNFWRIYNDWFGLTTAPEYRAQAAEQSPGPSLKQGESIGMYVRFRNTGNQDWYDDTTAYSAGKNPVRIATDLPLNHPSIFANGWTYDHRPGINFARMYDENGNIMTNTHIAKPGQSVEFWYSYKAPHTLAPGTYFEGFRPIVEGLGPMNDTGTYFVINVTPAIYTASFVDQSSFPSVTQYQKAPAFIRYKNTGNVAWYDDTDAYSNGQLPVQLATDYPLNRPSAFSSFWPYTHRAAMSFSAVYESNGTTLAANQHVAQPGQIVRFSFDMMATASTSPGFYGEPLRPVVQGKGPMNDTGTWMGINVSQAKYNAAYTSQSAFPTIAKGQSADVFINYKNTGNVAWYDDYTAWPAKVNPVKLGTDYPLNRSSVFGSTWIAPHRPGALFASVYEADGTTLAANQHIAQPGQVVKFNFKFTVPSNLATGFYGEPFRPVVEGLGPMNDTGTWLGINVTN